MENSNYIIPKLFVNLKHSTFNFFVFRLGIQLKSSKKVPSTVTLRLTTSADVKSARPVFVNDSCRMRV